MGFPFISAVVDAHLHATEDEGRVLSAVKTILPDGSEIKHSKLEGHYGNQIVSLESRIVQRGPLKELWRGVLSKLRAGELEKIRADVPKNMDDSCNLYLRFDKQSAYGGELVLTDSGDAVHVRLKVAAFPAKREVAVGIVEDFLGGPGNET